MAGLTHGLGAPGRSPRGEMRRQPHFLPAQLLLPSGRAVTWLSRLHGHLTEAPGDTASGHPRRVPEGVNSPGSGSFVNWLCTPQALSLHLPMASLHFALFYIILHEIPLTTCRAFPCTSRKSLTIKGSWGELRTLGPEGVSGPR